MTIPITCSIRGRPATHRGALSGFLLLTAAVAAHPATAAITCERNVTASIAALDQPVLFNRLGASNVNGTIFALQRDIMNKTSGLTLNNGGAAQPGNVQLRPDKRPRPLVLRVREGDCLKVKLKNLLAPAANPNNLMPPQFNVFIDEQVFDRHASFHVSGMQPVNSIADDGSFVGNNADSTVAPGGSRSYTLFAEHEGVFTATSYGATVGSDGNMGNTSNLLFGQVIVEPKGARIYRSTVTEEELRLATRSNANGLRSTAAGQPILNYNARYPNREPWISEGVAGLPVLNMMNPPGANAQNVEIVHSVIDGVIVGPDRDGSWRSVCPGPNCPYPLESVGLRNPSVPNRVEPFRDFASVFHDESAAAQAFPGFFTTDPVFNYVLAGVKDAFMINYGSGGIGSEIIANRLGVGPMHDCQTCAFEEFFLTSFTVGDPAQLVDIPANTGLETLAPGATPLPGTTGPKASLVPYPDDPGNVHHSYTGDFVKFRNTHNGKEQHVFHLHNHQWLYNPNDDNSNYLDAQGIGPGVGYTYEINFGGSGNRNKTAGDAIFHCHFYPHFAQGMWYLWRNHDVLETGTRLAVTGDPTDPDAFHTATFALEDGTPAVVDPATGARARALPDGEIVAGAPIPAIVPLPGKAMPPLPGEVQLVANPLTTTASIFNPATIDQANPPQVPVGSLASVVDRDVNPGFPFWVASIEDTVGQRPPTAPLEMATAAKAATLRSSGPTLPVKTADGTVLTSVDIFADLVPAQADGFDGGLPRANLQGYAAGGSDLINNVTRLDFSKVPEQAQAVFYPEEGTDVEQTAMAFHALREHPSFKVDMQGPGLVQAASFVANGLRPAIGAPFMEPCLDDQGDRLGAGVIGDFFGGAGELDLSTRGSSVFNADNARIYKAAVIQYDAVLNKVGYHYPQQRIITLWEDAVPVITKAIPGEPFVMRLNTFDCAVFHHTNLVPENYELDDYQVRTPTDIIGQHIHLPKWDLTNADGAANGWNYEDGTLSPGAVRERIEAINHFTAIGGTHVAGTGSGGLVAPQHLEAEPHPFFGNVAPAGLGPLWVGARTTTQRWFADPVVNTDGEDRGLGIIFTHDHFGPSTHQQIGLYATVLTEPAGSQWVHNETGQQLGDFVALGDGGRIDGGPTSWQAAILTPVAAAGGSTVKSENLDPFREFYFEFSDFQHAYEPGVYVGADQDGAPIGGPVGNNAAAMAVLNEGNPDFNGVAADAFRFAINPPAREQAEPVFPDLVVEVAGGITPICPERPCPQAIDVDDPGMFAVNYRNEPIALRVFDPNALGPDGKPGTQAAGKAGDLAYALQTRTDRVIPELNAQPQAGDTIHGTIFPPPINSGGVQPGDPFTPMMRTFAGDLVRVKMQAGGDEEEHNATIHGLKWLQAGSGHGKAGNSGWRNAQAAGISEQFTLTAPLIPIKGNTDRIMQDFAYNMDASQDGWWSGMWGLLRMYETNRNDLFRLPTTVVPTNGRPVRINNAADFDGVCPRFMPNGITRTPVRSFDITAVLANDVLPANLDVTIADVDPTGHVGLAPNANGGTLVYNPRTDAVQGQAVDEETGLVTFIEHQGPLHDPTGMLYVMTDDLQPKSGRDTRSRRRNFSVPVRLRPGVPVEPLVLRAAAGECIKLTLRNRLPANARDLPTYSALLGVVKRDRNGLEGSTTFQTNLITPSSFVGLHPQLVAYDVTRDDGVVVGRNVAGGAQRNAGVTAPNNVETLQWYAGDIDANVVRRGPRGRVQSLELVATPVELGTANLQPADKIKQGMKSLVGQLIIEPEGALIEDESDDASGRQTATVTADGTSFRDFSVVLTKGQTQYYADSSPVEHMNGEGLGIPEDSQEDTGMAINYGIEPAWFRLGILPQAAFGNTAPADSYGAQTQFDLYSNSLVGGDPATPVFLANAGQPFRMRVAVPHGTNRGTTFQLHGHVWQRDPYVCAGTKDGLVGRCSTTEVGSTAIGDNPLGFHQGGQESIAAPTHFDIVLPSAGGGKGIPGDYLFRDTASFGNASGLWGIVRVRP